MIKFNNDNTYSGNVFKVSDDKTKNARGALLVPIV